MSEFHLFGKAVRKRFAEMVSQRLYVVDTDGDKLWEKYLSSFPKGSDPIFRTKTEHDCRCCRQFIRAVGNVVTITDGVVSTIWDVQGLPRPYQVVADAMNAYVLAHRVSDIFITEFSSAGREKTKDAHDSSINWEHFSVEVPKRFVNPSPGGPQGKARTEYEVLKRGVNELLPAAVETVVDLIEQNNLYRGAEHKDQLLAFQSLQNRLRGKNDNHFWESYDAKGALIRNSVIGTLLIDLSERDADVEKCVKSFETKVAPTNYKRPAAIITPRMVEEAMKTIQELDLEPALERRHAMLSDVHITSVLWVDTSVQGKLKGGLAGKLMEEVKPAAFDKNKAKPIKIDEFLRLPHKGGIRVYLDNPLVPHLMSLTAPVHPEVKQLFRWNNDFCWSYNGDVADSIKEKVKRAGGQVEGVALRCSLAWYNYDDLDLHCYCPNGHVHFRDKMGILDVDMNAGGPKSRDAVENMRWPAPRDGNYDFRVHNFNRRETVDVGFEIEVESDLGIHSFRYTKSVAHGETIPVCTVKVKNGKTIEIKAADGVVAGAASQDAWGLKTLDLVKVQAVIQSPNYWEGNAVGNKHWFFILEGCRNPNPCRGIYNEYLHPRLEKHRRVFEMVGAKTKCPVSEQQLSGVGFSSTQKDQLIAVSGGVAYAISF